MATKKETLFTCEKCSCAEMLAQMKPQTKRQQCVGDACAVIMAEVYESQKHRGDCMEMMSQLIPVSCDTGRESDETFS